MSSCFNVHWLKSVHLLVAFLNNNVSLISILSFQHLHQKHQLGLLDHFNICKVVLLSITFRKPFS